jgi:hypothetical protein
MRQCLPGLPPFINLLGLCFGVDFLRPALKFPGIGRIGMDRE